MLKRLRHTGQDELSYEIHYRRSMDGATEKSDVNCVGLSEVRYAKQELQVISSELGPA